MKINLGLIIVASMCGGLSFIRAADGQPAFEVASVKMISDAPGRLMMHGGPGTADPDRFSCRNCSLKNLILTAYAVRFYQVAGVREMREVYDVEATLPSGTNDEQFRGMLRNLLTDRFKLSLHHETREMPVYNLAVGKNGPKMAPSQAAFIPPEPGSPTAHTLTLVSIDGQRHTKAVNETMEKFADALSILSTLPVYDATGLKGEYDFDLTWSSRDPGPARLPDGSAVQPPPDAIPDPTLFDAVKEQLGLRLDLTKRSVDVVVIDNFEKLPTKN